MDGPRFRNFGNTQSLLDGFALRPFCASQAFLAKSDRNGNFFSISPATRSCNTPKAAVIPSRAMLARLETSFLTSPVGIPTISCRRLAASRAAASAASMVSRAFSSRRTPFADSKVEGLPRRVASSRGAVLCAELVAAVAVAAGVSKAGR